MVYFKYVGYDFRRNRSETRRAAGSETAADCPGEASGNPAESHEHKWIPQH